MVQFSTAVVLSSVLSVLVLAAPSAKPNVPNQYSAQSYPSPINRRCFGGFDGCGGPCGFGGCGDICDFGGCGLGGGWGGPCGFGGCNGGWGGPCGFGGCNGGWGGCDGGFGPVFSENTCCNNEECFHASNFDANTEAAVFCDNVCCSEVDANCCDNFAQDSFFIC